MKLAAAFTRLLLFAAVALLLATAVSLAGGYWWFFELFVHFRPHYVLTSALLVLACLAARQWAGLGIGVLCLLVNGAIALAFFGQPASAVAAPGDVVRIASANIGGSAFDNSADIIEFVEVEKPDVLLLIELTPATLAALEESLGKAYPHAFTMPRTDYFGIGLFSRYPLEDRELLDLGYRDVPALSTRMTVGQEAIRLVGVHLEWPMTAAASRGRNTQLRNLPSQLGDMDEPTVLLGDFNLTRWAARFTTLLEATGLEDTAVGFGWQPTWPTWLPGLGITIDHCLASPSLRISDRRVGPHLGSDHLPLIVEFAL